MPKSGSHLILQVLQGLTEIGPCVNPGFPPVNRSEDNLNLDDAQTLRNLQEMLPGDIGYGYIQAREPFLSTLSAAGRAHIFVYRDPRDMVISHVFYATQMHPGHGMHRYYNDTLKTMEERIDAAICGVEEPGSELSSVRQKYAAYLGWLDRPEVLCLRFEDLILNRDQAFCRMLDYLEERGFVPAVGQAEALQSLNRSIQPKKSGTFRKGKPGNWREHFTPTNIALFKETAGDLLIRLGYEQGLDW